MSLTLGRSSNCRMRRSPKFRKTFQEYGEEEEDAPKTRRKRKSPKQRSNSRRTRTKRTRHLMTEYQSLLEKFKKQCDVTSEIRNEMQQQKDVYERQGAIQRVEIEKLNNQLGRKRDKQRDKRYDITSIHDLHKDILTNIAHIQGKTSQILKEQEKDLLRAFSQRLSDVKKSINQEKERNLTSTEWMQKCHKLSAEINFIRDQAYSIEAENRKFQEENSALTISIKTLESDRQFLIRQLLALKKQNNRLKRPVIIPEEPVPLARRPSSALGMRGEHRKVNMASNELFTRTVATIKRQLDAERRKVKRLEVRLNSETAKQTELATFIKQSIEDVQAQLEIEQQQGKRPSHGKTSRTSSIYNFSQRERARILENLFAKEQVLTMMYNATFPYQFQKPKTDKEEFRKIKISGTGNDEALEMNKDAKQAWNNNSPPNLNLRWTSTSPLSFRK